MNNFTHLDERLDQLGQELTGPPAFADEIMAKISTCDVQRPSHRRWLPTLTVLATAACVLIAVGFWLSQPQTLYAQAIAALDDVQTIHVTGWTSHLFRKWPLEVPSQQGTADRHAVEAWFWTGASGTNRSYEKFGPVFQLRNGDELKEYQSDADLTFESKDNSQDQVERLSSIAVYLKALEDEGAKVEQLGTKTKNGQDIRGLKLQRHGRSEEYWFDAKTDLPTKYIQSKSGKEGVTTGFELTFAYDQEVPAEIASYKPPETKHVRYGGRHDDIQVVWKQHVQDLGQRLQQTPATESIRIMPRVGQQRFSLQYTKRTPDDKYWVIPLDHDQHFPLTVKNFVNLRVSMNDGDRAFERWRVSIDLLDVEFPRADLVCENETPWQKWVAAALDQLDLEYIDVKEEREFWIAEHDGRKLKPFAEVNPPVPYVVEAGRVKKGLVRLGVGHILHPVTMGQLLQDFNRLQNLDFNGQHPVVVDQTGLPQAPQFDRAKYSSWDEYKQAVNYDQYLVATDSPWFNGDGALKMARDWYGKEFGITFRGEKRMTTVHVIRRKP